VAGKKWFRLSGLSRGGKYALCHLLAFSVALMALGSGGGALAYVLFLILGLPLLCLPMLFPDLLERRPPSVAVLLFVGLMVANSYLVGHAAAGAQVLAEWVRSRRRGSESGPR
jgi:hypothetical protein